MGVCNLFFFTINKKGEKELITPMLDGTILPGILRDSILVIYLKYYFKEITREMKEFKVTERKLYI